MTEKYEWKEREVIEATAKGVSTVLHLAAAALMKLETPFTEEMSEILAEAGADINIALGGPEVAKIYDTINELMKVVKSKKSATATEQETDPFQIEFDFGYSGEEPEGELN